MDIITCDAFECARSDRSEEEEGGERGSGIWGLPRRSLLRHSVAFSDVAASGRNIEVDVGVIKYYEVHIKTTPQDICEDGEGERTFTPFAKDSRPKRVRMANLGITRDEEVDGRDKIVYLYH